MTDIKVLQRAWSILALCQIESYLIDHGRKKHAKNISRAADELLELYEIEFGLEAFSKALLLIDEATQKAGTVGHEARH